MLANFASGGAAICVLAREAGARLVVVDAGVIGGAEIAGVRSEIVDGVRGTDDLTLGPAMSRSTAVGAIERGIALAGELADDGVEIVGLGEMGIGNTTAASALTAALPDGGPRARVRTGDGTRRRRPRTQGRRGAPGPGGERSSQSRRGPGRRARRGRWARDRVPRRRVPRRRRRRVAILLDGFITSAAALVATRMQPASAGSMIAATRSPEPGHALVLEALGLEPLLDLRLRLGEGTGAALALPLVRSAVAILTDMATFDSAGVSGRAARSGRRGAGGRRCVSERDPSSRRSRS